MTAIFNFLFSYFLLFGLSEKPAWKELQPGLMITDIPVNNTGSEKAVTVTVLKIDLQLWELIFMGRTFPVENPEMTGREWSSKYNLAAVINAGMFATDNNTHVGYLKYNGYLNNSHLNDYKSVIAFNPGKWKNVSPVKIFDLDLEGASMKNILEDYNSAIQNLRLIKKPGISVWGQQENKWSEAALGEDGQGNVLFIFSRYPFSMHNLNEILLSSGIGIVAAQHLEGGPEAQLYIKVDGFEFEQFGSFESSYNENDNNDNPVPIPNILGIRRKHN
jgi:hypothetical protein